MVDNDFIKTFVRYFDDTEVNRVFALWSAIGAISAVAGRRLWVNFDIDVIYPNLYICLIAGAGQLKKSTAILTAAKLVSGMAAGPRTISDSVTVPALVGSLVNRAPPGEEPDNSGFSFCDELSNFINRHTYEQGIATVLTKMWDGSPYEYDTISRGKEVLKNTCLGILSGTTIDLIRNSIPTSAIGDGLTSRFIFVYQDTPPKPIPFPLRTEAQKKSFGEMIAFLNRIRGLTGAMTFTPEAIRHYEQDYIEFYNNSPMFHDPHLKSYASRRFKMAIKIAMILALSRGETNLTISELDYERSIIILKDIEPMMSLVLRLVASSDLGTQISFVNDILRIKRVIPRHELLKLVSHRISSLKEFTDVIQMLISLRTLVVTQEGGTTIYRYTSPR